MKELNKNKNIPLYEQLKKKIKEKIKNNKHKNGQKIKSERELAKEFQISRMTVRKAIKELVNEGYLFRKSGLGTFVEKSKFNKGLLWLTSFTEDMKQRGLKPSSKTLYIDKIEAPTNIKNKLELLNNDYIYILKRLRLANNKPMALENSHISVELLEQKQVNNLDNNSLYEILKNNGVSFSHADETLEGGVASTQEANLLNIKRGDPVIYRERTTYNKKNKKVEYVNSVYRADRYKFHFKLRKR